MVSEPAFEVEITSEFVPGETLIVGVADIGVAGLTAVDYLTTHVESEQIGHVKTRNLPDITPFSEGKPRRPMRLYSTEDPNLTIFISEVFLPVGVADSLTDTLFDWISTNGLREIAILYGAPFPHAEEEHVVFHVGTDRFREKHFADSDIEPLAGGFFDGVVGELVTRGLDESAPPIGVLVTPAHFPGPDFDGALRLINGVEAVYDVEIDEDELKERSEEMKKYYQEFAERMQMLREEEQPFYSRDYPEDRMYM